MRDDIRIPAEMYNEFDRAVKEGLKEQMIESLDKIGSRLLNLQKRLPGDTNLSRGDQHTGRTDPYQEPSTTGHGAES
jgi:hypothetical protein